MELILDNVIFYTKEQMKSYTRYLINDLKKQLYMDEMIKSNYKFINDNLLYEKWMDFRKKTKILPSALPTDPTSSAHKIIRYWRSILSDGDSPFSTIDNIEAEYKKGVRTFVLVDDFSGSGGQITDVLNYKVHFFDELIEVGKLAELHNDLTLIFAVYVIHERAKKLLRKRYPHIEVMYVDELDDDFNFMNEQSSMYQRYDDNTRMKMINTIKDISEKIMLDNKDLNKLSSYILNIPIVFEHGCPNNTLILLFAHTDDWQQLFKRGEEI